MYRELLAELSKGYGWVRPQPPCPEAEIAAAEKALGCPFPPELRALLRELNGDKWLLLSASDIVKNAEQNRKAYLPLFEEDIGEPCCWKPVAKNITEFLTRYYRNEI